MGQIGPWQIIIVAVVVVLLFGRGKISELMGDVAKGIKSFKKGLKDEEAESAATLDHKDAQVMEPAEKKTEAS
jgi:sec-independent protein translocase protein TatA